MSRPEKLIIRPPSEWRSMLLRSTRGCNWNRCRFCGIYPALGEPEFSVRRVEEVKRDIEWFQARAGAFETAFIGDADPLCRPIEESVDILQTLRRALPRLRRVTAYARAGTLYRLGAGGLRRLSCAGLDRVHIGLESGDRATLTFHRKGQSPGQVVKAARWAREAGIDVSMYVLLGLGGRSRWREHVDATAEVITKSRPAFVRIRRIWMYAPDDSPTGRACPLLGDMQSGTFEPQSPEGTVKELGRLVEKIGDIDTHLVCDHANNYVTVEGDFPRDRDRMAAEIAEFLSRPEAERMRRYRDVGSRI